MATSGMKIYGLPASPSTMRVLACAYEKDIPFDLVPVDLRNGEQKKEAFLARNPFGQIPVVEDGDLTLFESRAITLHESYKHAGKGTDLVVVDDPTKMAQVCVWMQVETTQFDPIASNLAFELVFKPFFDGKVTDDAAVKEAESKLAQVLDVYEGRLSRCKYLAGDAFTLADLHHIPAIHYLVGTQISPLFRSRPHVSAWCDDMLNRPAWKKVVESANANKN